MSKYMENKKRNVSKMTQIKYKNLYKDNRYWLEQFLSN